MFAVGLWCLEIMIVSVEKSPQVTLTQQSVPSTPPAAVMGTSNSVSVVKLYNRLTTKVLSHDEGDGLSHAKTHAPHRRVLRTFVLFFTFLCVCLVCLRWWIVVVEESGMLQCPRLRA